MLFMETLSDQPCPFCHENKLTLSEDVNDIPYFGKTYLFSMKCSNCSFSKSDVEAEHPKEPSKITFSVENEKDLQVRVVKSSYASIKIPELKLSVTPGPASEGYVSNIEGIFDRFKKIIEQERDTSEEDEEKEECKKLLKKIWKVKLGDIKVKVIIEDPSGNSGIISPKAKIEKLAVKQ